MKCPVCNAELPSTAKFCGSCGTTLAPPPPSLPVAPEQARPAMNVMNAHPSYEAGKLPAVQRKYKVLRFIAVLMKVFAFIAGGILSIAGLMLIVAGASAGSRGGGPFVGNTSLDIGPTGLWGGALTGLALLAYGVFVFIFLYAYSEWMYVFMDIEENTRVTNEMLSGRRS
jgi:zinc-ribbon domain